MLRSDALRNKIYLMSFNLTVVLSRLLNRGRHTPQLWERRLCRCRCVYESRDLASQQTNSRNPYTASRLHYSPQRGRKKKKNTTQPLSPHHHLCEQTTGFRFLYPLRVTHEDRNLIIDGESNPDVYNFLTLSECTAGNMEHTEELNALSC